MKLELPTEIRPIPALMKYYALTSFVAGPFFIFPLIALIARYRSLRYQLDAEGISMRWGILFRREVSLSYARIQDIHLSSNVVERWLGLGKIQVQTASGSAKAEMTVEGVPDLDGMRDFLYARMRGARGEIEPADPEAEALTTGAGDLTATLRAVASELRALRADLAGRAGTASSDFDTGPEPPDA